MNGKADKTFSLRCWLTKTQQKFEPRSKCAFFQERDEDDSGAALFGLQAQAEATFNLQKENSASAGL